MKGKKTKALALILAILLGFMSFPQQTYAVDPSYTVSESYKNGRYYAQLKSVKMTGDQAKDIVEIAKSQVGYHEGTSASDLSGEGTNKTNSYTEYSSTLHKHANVAWCAYFVSWCARQARIPISVIPKNGRASIICEESGLAGTYYDVTSGYVPQPGDLFFLEPTLDGAYYIAERSAKTGIPALSSHVGIITKVSGGRMYFVEGNAGELVRSSSIPLQTKRGNKYWVQGYVHPKYDSNSTVDANDNTVNDISTAIKVSTTKAVNITTTNAIVYGHVEKPSSSVKIKTCGLYLGTSKSNLSKQNEETVSDGANNKDGGTGFDIWYDLKGELGTKLSPGTTYYYQFYCKYGNQEIKSDIASFKTIQTTTIYNQKVYVLIDKGHKVTAYSSADGNTVSGYLNATNESGSFVASKYADLPNGSRRFLWVNSNGVEFWIPYDSSYMWPEYYPSQIIPSETHIYISNADDAEYILTFKQSPSNADDYLEAEIGYDRSVVWVNDVDGKGEKFRISGQKPGTTNVKFVGYWSGTSTTVKITVVDSGAPEFSKAEVTASDEDGYQVMARVTDKSLKRLGVKTWNEHMNEGDAVIEWLGIEDDNGAFSFDTDGWPNYIIKDTIKFADFDNASGTYMTRFYAEDTSGNLAEITVDYTKQSKNPNVSEIQGVTRVYGDTRYETGYAVAEALKEVLDVEKFEAVVVATGKNFADALAGSYLAVKKNAPIILTNGKDDNVAQLHAYIKENVTEGGKVYILGGEAAVPAIVEAIDGYDVVRLFGDSRYDTNLVILGEAGVSDDSIIVATGKTFADSLSASAVKLPILLVKPNAALNGAQKEILAGMKNIYIVGGEGAVSAAYAEELAAYGEVTRVFGDSRYDTSVEIAKTFCTDAEKAVVASGKNFPDGLCGGPLAAALNAPLVLTKDDAAATAAVYVAENGIVGGFVLGGDGALTDATVVEVFGLESTEEIIEE